MSQTSTMLPQVMEQNGKAMTTSRAIAEYFGKEHFNVLRDIRDVLTKCSQGFGQLNFEESSYINEQNKEQPMYNVYFDGFMMVVMGYTGEKAMQMKEAYIEAFNKMRNLLAQKDTDNFGHESTLKAAKFILKEAGITGNQLVLALDKVYNKHIGYSLLEVTDTHLIAPTSEQLITPTEIGKQFKRKDGKPYSPKQVNDCLCSLGYQIKSAADGKWEPTSKGLAAGGVMLDVTKKNGRTSTRQLKWPSSILQPVAQVLVNN